MAIERTWTSVPARLLTLDGNAYGELTIESTSGFRVKQQVLLESTALSTLTLEVKRVVSSTVILLGEPNKGISNRVDLSAYLVTDFSTLRAPEQSKNKVPKDDQRDATYEREPVVARRVFNVDEFGNPFNNNNPLPTKPGLDRNSYRIPKLAYDSGFNLQYMSDAVIGVQDNQNSHFIQEFLYDGSFNLTRVVIATDTSTCNCTDVSVAVLTPGLVARITTTTGDFSEVNVGDDFTLTTPTQTIVGSISLVESTTSIQITLPSFSGTLVAETATTILTTDLLITFKHSSTSGYEKRRWDHRDRYIYATL